ncbi:MAG: DNA mismatch repair endonuclease MutL [Ignavibacteriae bacterium]|nr:DNA mismatch repair endonuclease MutL [Ignavibacteriota bacterium]
MAQRIHILRADVANKIAAGEVVQRPAAAVKELVENALDANAKKISIIVKGAGKTWLQVIDDGDGMNEADAALAFQRHATSKITSAEDLENIRTLGFRGEALASIAAVAQVEMRTRTRSEDVGTLLRVEGNEEKERSKASIEPGTNIIVKNLFYNTPARRNFLKSDHTELKNITEAVTRMAVIYPDVAWQYVSEDETLLDLKPGSAEDRFIDVFGERHFKSIVNLAETTDYLSLNGFIGKPDFGRKSRNDQYLYINKRYITSRAISHAVFHAYEHLMVKGAFPFFVLNITLDPRKVDVNVHPSKMEVKFENESNIYRFVLSVIRKTLAAHDLIPSVSLPAEEGLAELNQRLGFSTPATVERETLSTGGERSSGHSWWSTPVAQPSTNETSVDVTDIEQLFSKIERRMGGERALASTQQAVDFPQQEKVFQHEPAQTVSGREPAKESRAIWQLHNKYILSQIRTGLLIVDQHVAHERVLYEKVQANFEKDLPSSQQLLFPKTVQLGAHDYTLVKELLPHLEKLGFNIKLFGKNTVVIEGIPADVRVGDESAILQDVLGEFKRNENAEQMDARDNIAKSFACKAAIKAGDKLNTTEMISLIDQLFATQMPYVCPHGRPVVIKLSIEELDKRFGRT